MGNALINFLAFWQRGKDRITGIFLSILAAMLNIGYGIYLIDVYSVSGYAFIMLGMAFVALGLYLIIRLAYDLIRGE